MAKLSNILTGQSNLVTDQDLAAVATTGSYSDLTNKPIIFSGSYNDLTNKPTIPTVPTLATVATTGSYTDLTNKPVVATLKVSSIAYPGDDIAADTAGGQTITLTGTGFTAGLSVLVNTTMAAVVTVVSSTQVTFTAPAMAAGTYVLYLVATDGSVALSLPGISYSGTPAWSTSAGTLGTQYETTAISKSLSATGDGTVTYSLLSGTLPTGSTLNTSTGAISGTAPSVNSSTTYNFTIRATDSQNQDTDRAFSITLTPDTVTWTNPATDLTVTADINTAYTQALAATSIAGNSVSYAANQLPTGVTVSGSNLTGTATAEETVVSTITATAANSNKTATRTITFNIVVAGEPFFKNVILLLTGNGATTNNNTFLDSSPNNFTITRYGNTSQGSFSPYGSTWSNQFNGSSYLQSPATTALNFGTNDFTVEFWMYVNSTSTSQDLFGDVNNSGGLGIALFSNTFYYGDQGVSNIFGITFTNYYNQWLHVAVSRNSGTSRIFFNGVLIATSSDSINYSNSTGVLVGKFTGRNNYTNGYLSNIRVVKGTGLYTSGFTPSTTPLTAVSGTSFLTCQSNRFIDNSTNNFAITPLGAPTVERFNPFGAGSAYSTSVIGGSAYFDGSDDYLTVPYNSAFNYSSSIPFTIDFWFYPTIGGVDTAHIASCSTGPSDSNLNWLIRQKADNTLRFVTIMGGAIPNDSTDTFKLNQWNHVAVVMTGSAIKLWLNGVYQGSVSCNGSQQVNGTIAIGYWQTYYNGYISDFRYTNTQVYTGTSNITIPTVPLTAVSGTQVLNNMSSAGIFDNAMMNNFETVGTAQVSTAFKKYGSGSLLFNGTSDYIRSRQKIKFDLTFCIEFWMYRTSTSGNQWIVCNGQGYGTTDPANGFLVGYYQNSIAVAGGNLGAYWINGTAPININTWHHVAVCGLGTGCAIYIDGTLTKFQAWPGGYTGFTMDGIIVGAGTSSVNQTEGSTHYGGYIDDLRITKGGGRYYSNFTPPTETFKLR
jgi:hypothetical protein